MQGGEKTKDTIPTENRKADISEETRMRAKKKTRKSLRKWATPLIVGSFLVMGASGVAMFFHAETTLMKVLHEWAGWVMVFAAGAHLVLNWRAFTTYFKRPLAAGIMGAGAVVLGLTLLPIGSAQDTGDITQLAMGALSGGQIETLAKLAGADTETVLEQLGAAGIAAQATDTPRSLSAGDRMAQMEIITAIFSDGAPSDGAPAARVE